MTSGKRGEIGPEGPPGKIGKVGSQGEVGPRGIPGRRGPKGDVGGDSLHTCKWLPEYILGKFRLGEKCCYFFPKNGSGYKKDKDKIVSFTSHSGAHNATAVKASTSPKRVFRYQI